MIAIQAELRELDAYDRDVLGGSAEYKEAQMKKAVREFNAKPKRGIEQLIESELCDGKAAGIAEWLYTHPDLKKGAIGEYMGENKPLNLEVLDEFCKCHDFAGRSFDMSLRAYLSSFRLPGEAQKIDRMMEAYAARFCACNPGVFSNSDTCYILAFATIMLNTGLHNPAVKNKQTLESFKRQVSGINDGADLPADMLTELFTSIQTNPFKLPEDEDGTLASVFMNPERSGYLTKEGGKTKNWKKRWFTLVNGCLYYFENEGAKTPKGIVPLENLKVDALEGFKAKKNCFELTSNMEGGTVKGAKTNSKGQFVQARHASYKIAADTPEVMDEWIKCIRAAMSPGFGYDLFSTRRLAQAGGGSTSSGSGH